MLSHKEVDVMDVLDALQAMMRTASRDSRDQLVKALDLYAETYPDAWLTGKDRDLLLGLVTTLDGHSADDR
jgi:hypothetical protein